VHHGQRPAPASQFPGDGDVRDRGSFATPDEPHPPVVQSPVAEVTASPRRDGCLFPSLPHDRADVVAGTVMPGCFDQQPAGVPVAGLGDRPCTRDCPEENSEGTSPTNEPMLFPVNRSQSPITTAQANRSGR
jgi:hypothetical protein